MLSVGAPPPSERKRGDVDIDTPHSDILYISNQYWTKVNENELFSIIFIIFFLWLFFASGGFG